MNRTFDPIDIVFIALITLYFLLLITIILLLINTRKDKAIRFKVVQIIHPKKVKKRKKKPQKVISHVKDEHNLAKKATNNKTKSKEKNNINNNQNVRYKGKAPTKKKTNPRKKVPKTNGKNKKRK